eukprot:1144950-Pelagomonas_calceolata.AAC.3
MHGEPLQSRTETSLRSRVTIAPQQQKRYKTYFASVLKGKWALPLLKKLGSHLQALNLMPGQELNVSAARSPISSDAKLAGGGQILLCMPKDIKAIRVINPTHLPSVLLASDLLTPCLSTLERARSAMERVCLLGGPPSGSSVCRPGRLALMLGASLSGPKGIKSVLSFWVRIRGGMQYVGLSCVQQEIFKKL